MTQGRRRLPALARQGRDETETAVVDETSRDDLGDLPQGSEQITTAIVEDISPDGIAMVVLSGEAQACEASSLLQFPSAAAASEALLGRTVLVLLGRHALPVILGAVAPRLWEQRDADSPSEAEAKLPAGARVVQLDKRRLEFEASEEIRLTCGKSSLVLRRDGTVVVRGVTIVSRASQSNKIRGGTVSIN